jgi:predicted TIM-barrel fold metal-dependent hydrolase
MHFGKRFYWPIYEAAAEFDLPVAVHPGWEGGGISYPPTPAGYPSSYFEWHNSLVCNYIGHLSSLVAEGVFQKFPKMKFVLVEGGVSWLPPVLWRMDKNWKGLRMTVPWLDRPPSEIVAEHVLVTTQPIEEPVKLEHLHQIYSMFPAEKMVMFSSDFPHWDGDTPDFVSRLLPAAVRSRVMSETARELYRLPAAATSDV